MKSSNIDGIIRSCSQDLPPSPCVGLGERVTRAIELMVSHNVGCIAVVRHRRVIGMIRLEDAFREIGLQVPDRF